MTDNVHEFPGEATLRDRVRKQPTKPEKRQRKTARQSVSDCLISVPAKRSLRNAGS